MQPGNEVLNGTILLPLLPPLCSLKMLELMGHLHLTNELSVKSVQKRNSVQTRSKTESHLFLGKNEFCLGFPTS